MDTGFSGSQAAKVVGISYRQLDYWARTDLIRPSLADAQGSGSRRRYSYQDLLELRVIKTLLDAGIKLESVRRVFDYLRTHVTGDIASAHLVISGQSVVLADGDRLVDVLREGQGVLNVLSLAGVKEDIDAQLVPLVASEGNEPNSVTDVICHSTLRGAGPRRRRDSQRFGRAARDAFFAGAAVFPAAFLGAAFLPEVLWGAVFAAVFLGAAFLGAVFFGVLAVVRVAFFAGAAGRLTGGAVGAVAGRGDIAAPIAARGASASSRERTRGRASDSWEARSSGRASNTSSSTPAARRITGIDSRSGSSISSSNRIMRTDTSAASRRARRPPSSCCRACS